MEKKKKKSSPYQPYSQLLGNHFYGICRPLWKNRLPKASICQYFTKFRFSLLFLVLNCGHTCPQTNVNRKGPGKPHKLSKWPWGISSSGMLSLPTRKGILEDKFKLVLWKPINLQHLLDDVLTSAVTSIPFIPTPKQPANPTSQLQMQWILDSIRVKKQSRSCLQYSSGTLQVYDVTLSVSLLLSREAWTSI